MKLFLIMFFGIALTVFAHDEGHGPKLTDAPKQGGVVSPVVLASEAKLGTKASLKYKAEIVRSQDGLVRVYLYDQKMNPLDAAKLGKTGKGELISGKRGKLTVQKFTLTWKGDHFEGPSPKPSRKPYDIDVKFSEGSTDYLVAFDNLD